MDISILIMLATAFIGAIGYALKALLERLNDMEKQIALKATEQETRQIMDDKILPLKESMYQIKTQVDKVIDLLIQNK